MATRTHIEGACLAAAVALCCAAGSAEAQVEGAQFGTALARCDFNGDRFQDLAVAANEAWVDPTGRAGKVFVLYGGPRGLRHLLPGGQAFSQGDLGTGFPDEEYAWFGTALAGGDFNRDGYCDLTVTTSQAHVGATFSAGLVNVVYGSPEGLIVSSSSDRPQPDLRPRTFTQRDLGDEVEGADQLGTAAAAADFNGDGYADVAVSAAGETVDGKAYAGVVHVIYGSPVGLRVVRPAPTTLTQRTMDGPDEVEVMDFFGTNLAAGDFDRDGYADLAVGAPFEYDVEVEAMGRVTLFYGAGAGLGAYPSRSRQLDEGTLEGSGQRGRHYFSSALTSGDFNGDGYRDLAIGSSGDFDANGIQGGTVHVLFGSRKGLSTRGFQHLGQDMPADIGDQAEQWDLFGNALASDDFNGDGIADLAVGATGERIGDRPISEGLAHIIYGSPSGLTSTGNQIVEGYPAERTGPEFAFSLAAGDFDRDGRADLAIGSPLAVSSLGEIAVGTMKVVYPLPGGRSEQRWWPW